jgi:hypothetical protein
MGFRSCLIVGKFTATWAAVGCEPVETTCLVLCAVLRPIKNAAPKPATASAPAARIKRRSKPFTPRLS